MDAPTKADTVKALQLLAAYVADDFAALQERRVPEVIFAALYLASRDEAATPIPTGDPMP